MRDAYPTAEQHPASLKPNAVLILAGFGLFLVMCGVFSLCVAFASGESLAARLLMIALAVAALFLPAFFAFASLRLKWTTGRWTLSPEERRSRLVRRATHPSRIVQFASSPVVRNVTDGMMVVLAVMNIWLEMRNRMHPFEVTLVAIWALVAALFLWRILRGRWTTSAS